MKEFLESLTQGQEPLSQSLVDAILAEFETRRLAWQTEKEQALAAARFDRILSDTIHAQGGRNVTAIAALLDLSALQKDADPTAATARAVKALKQEHDYLFATANTAPPYSRGTGIDTGAGESTPNTLAGALREKFSK